MQHAGDRCSLEGNASGVGWPQDENTRPEVCGRAVLAHGTASQRVHHHNAVILCCDCVKASSVQQAGSI